MHHYALIALLSATPNIDRIDASPTAGVELVQPRESMDWLDELVLFLEWWCEMIGPEYCKTENGTADDHMLHFIDAYTQHGISGDLSASDQVRGQVILEEIHQHVSNPEEGSPAVLSSMLTAVEEAYEDLGGSPDDL